MSESKNIKLTKEGRHAERIHLYEVKYLEGEMVGIDWKRAQGNIHRDENVLYLDSVLIHRIYRG